MSFDRYASKEIKAFFSPQNRYEIWRKLWIALAEAQKELGLAITDDQIREMKSHISDIDFEKISTYEKTLAHDVVSHLKAFCDLCPKSAPIIHLGATSCFVTDNADLIIMKEALFHIEKKMRHLIVVLSEFALKHKDLACLSYTHLQPAQPTTYGKRASLWLQDFLFDLKEISNDRQTLLFLGVKGATGTQSSFLALFQDPQKVKKLDHLVAQKMGFEKLLPLSSQTYPRKLDVLIFNHLSGLSISAHKLATDIRLLSSFRELEEPISENQVGSSAMPHKRNPILSERICSLSRFLIALSQNPSYTAATQWLERSLDDSANRRIAIPEAFFCADAILSLLIQLIEGLTLFPEVIKKRLDEELPFLATEVLLMAIVKKGGNRQHFHEKLKKLAFEASYRIKEGQANDLLEKIGASEEIPLSLKEIKTLLDEAALTGMASHQVDEFLKNIKEL